jgi:peptidoglycan/LPS O-acetylase OafA/YrhL
MGKTERNCEKESRVIFLDWLRVFAFMSVLLSHKFAAQLTHSATDPSLPVCWRFSAAVLALLSYKGIAGVVVFFLVSGYIITRVLYHERPAVFFIKRFFRIYPLYISAVLTHVALLSWTGQTVPSATVLSQQLLLIGDLFHTPYALGDVEWTLRIEAAFYLVMGLLSVLGFWHRRQYFLRWSLLLAVPALGFCAPIPSWDHWSRSHVTNYGLFLLLGAAFYLTETGRPRRWFLPLMGTAVLAQYYLLMINYAMVWQDAHFAVLGCALFSGCWFLRNAFPVNTPILFLSGLTYSVYLFHQWSWSFLIDLVQMAGVPWVPRFVQVLLLLCLTCVLVSRLIEQPSVRLGRALARRLRNDPGAREAANPPTIVHY